MKHPKFRSFPPCAAIILALVLSLQALPLGARAAGVVLPAAPDLGLDCRGAVLMEAQTGQILYEQNADEPLPPASVTKIMTLLLVMEAIDSGALGYDDLLTVSENAASMGGSQIFLETGEQMTVRDLLKSVVISSANDAAVVLAEAVAGSEKGFVERMNRRAAELGMATAHFENTNGLDDTTENHVLSARDIALMSRALIAHRDILGYSSTWMDTVRDGAFGLSNTNRLIRTYPGATGLKTGSTSKALFCISASAERDGVSLIAVIMGAPTRDVRNAAAAALLDWGFANFSVYRAPAGTAGELPVTGGSVRSVGTEYGEFSCVLPKGQDAGVIAQTQTSPSLAAPFGSGTEAGYVRYMLGEVCIGQVPVRTRTGAERLSFSDLFVRMLRAFCLL